MAPRLRLGGRSVVLSNPDKVLYPSTGFRKRDVVEYYLRVAPAMLPHLSGRAVTLKRYPDGVEGESFYEKRCPSHRPEWMPVATGSTGSGGELVQCRLEDAAGLAWVQNLAALELHVLLSRHQAPEVATVIAFDLDPGPPAGILEAARVALLLRDTLARLGLTSVAKASGKAGLHVYVPLNGSADFATTKAFARRVALTFERAMPELVVSRMAKRARAGKIFVDWSQNDQHKTTVCVYSLRATPEPRVSAPVAWGEVEEAVADGGAGALWFGPAQVLARLERHGDLFAPVLDVVQELPPGLLGRTRR